MVGGYWCVGCFVGRNGDFGQCHRVHWRGLIIRCNRAHGSAMQDALSTGADVLEERRAIAFCGCWSAGFEVILVFCREAREPQRRMDCLASYDAAVV